MVDGWTNYETKWAYEWLASSPDEGRYLEAKEEASYGIYRFRVWAEDALTRIPEWDDEDTAEVNYQEVMDAILTE